jgi:hypothetical protein
MEVRKMLLGDQACVVVDLPPTWQQLIQWLFGLGGTKNQQRQFSNQANTTAAITIKKIYFM